jgi:SAM-dependent methyltransferase
VKQSGVDEIAPQGGVVGMNVLKDAVDLVFAVLTSALKGAHDVCKKSLAPVAPGRDRLETAVPEERGKLGRSVERGSPHVVAFRSLHPCDDTRRSMSDASETWHYGLVARWWAEFNTATPIELAFYRTIIERYGQPALDLACGTGRLLLPLRRDGLEVDGCDISTDMVGFCRAQAASEGLAPELFVQASSELHLPRTYRTIYICDSFGIAGSAEALRRCYHHLAPGGALAFNVHLPYQEADRWNCWLPEHRRSLPEAWPDTGMRKRAANGDEIELRSRRLNLDPLEQVWTREIRATLWRNSEVVKEEVHGLRERAFFRNEVLLLLAQAGFADVAVKGDYDERDVKEDDLMLVFIARK